MRRFTSTFLRHGAWYTLPTMTSTRPGFISLFKVRRPVIGMLHAPPLPGSPRSQGSWRSLEEHVMEDARLLVEGGVHGLMIENFGDSPFYPDRVPPHVVACLTALAARVKRTHDRPLGINVLRNDGVSALGVALAAGADFIRVNVLCGARVTDQGIIQGIAHDLLRLRANLDARHILVLADVDVKHSAPLADMPLDQDVADLVHRGGADAVIVSGSGTGRKVEISDVTEVKKAAGDAPVLIGSGVTADTLGPLLATADAVIVGTSLKVDGIPAGPVDPRRVEALMVAWSKLPVTNS